MNLAKDSIVLTIGRGAGFLVSFVVPILLVRLLSVAEFGEYRQIMLILNSASAILPLGAPLGLFYFFPRFPNLKREHLLSTIVLIATSGILFWVLLVMFGSQLASYFRNPKFVQYMPFLGAAVFTCMLSMLIETVLVADNRATLSAAVTTAARFARSFAIILCAFVGGLSWVLYGLPCVFGLITILSFVYLVKVYNLHGVDRSALSCLSNHLKYTLPLGLTGIFVMLYETVDKLMLSHFVTAEKFAIYAVGSYELPLISVIFSSITDVVLPRVVELRHQRRTADVVALWHKSVEKSMLIGIPLFAFFFVFAEDFITLMFTAKYSEAAPIFRVALWAVILESSRYGLITRAYARTNFSLKVSMLGLLIAVPACYSAIMYFGAMGAICSITTTKTFIVVAEILYAKRLLDLNWRRILPMQPIAKIVGACSASILITCGLLWIINLQNVWLKLSVALVCFFAAYSLATLAIRLWRFSDLPYIEHLRKGTRSYVPSS